VSAPLSCRRFPIGARALLLLTLLVGCAPLASAAQEEALTLERLFNSPEFFGEGFGPARWLGDGRYTTLEASGQIRGGVDIVAYGAESGEREILIPASELVPSGSTRPLAVEG